MRQLQISGIKPYPVNQQLTQRNQKEEPQQFFSRERPMSHQITNRNVSYAATQMRMSFTSILGDRLSNEDKEARFQLDNLSIAALFDGHNGSFASDFCANNIEREFTKQLKACQNMKETIKQTIYQLNNQLSYYSEVKECGTTCVIIVVDYDAETITIGNVGDSRCLVGLRSDEKFISTVDHKPNLEAEKKRLNMCGAHVEPDSQGIMRVSGFSVSRTLGDSLYKDIGVSAEADIYQYDMKSCLYLLVACDGLWDVYTNEQIDEVVRAVISFSYETDFQKQFLEQYNGKRDDNYKTITINGRQRRVMQYENVNTGFVREKRVSQALTKMAVLKGSTDNISVGVCFL